MPDEEKPESSTGENQDAAPPEGDEPETDAQDEQDEPESSTGDEESPEPGEGESVSPSEGAKPSGGEHESKAERRIKQLTAQVKSLQRQMTQSPQKPAVQAVALNEPKPPTLEESESVEAYETAMKKYVADMGKFQAAQAVERDRAERQQKAEKEEREKQEKSLTETWTKREAATQKRIPDYNKDEALAVVSPNDVSRGFLVDSDIGPDLLWHLYENPDEADRIRELPPYKAVRELVKLEERLSSQIKGIKPKNPPPKPPGQVSGRASAHAGRKSAADVLYG